MGYRTKKKKSAGATSHEWSGEKRKRSSSITVEGKVLIGVDKRIRLVKLVSTVNWDDFIQ